MNSENYFEKIIKSLDTKVQIKTRSEEFKQVYF